jgi:hypothetical protein
MERIFNSLAARKSVCKVPGCKDFHFWEGGFALVPRASSAEIGPLKELDYSLRFGPDDLQRISLTQFQKGKNSLVRRVAG